MKCDTCNQEEVMSKKYMAGRNQYHLPVIHHECPASHKWHVVIAGIQTTSRDCDCLN